MSETPETLQLQLRDSVLPNHLPDVEWLLRYLDDGCPSGPPLFLSLGESWPPLHPDLSRLLSQAPDYGHGYQLSMYGLPALRRELRDLVVRTHGLPAGAGDFEVAVTWSGTRSTMFDFGRLLLDRRRKSVRPPVLLCTAPGWDFAGVFEPLGYRVEYVPLDAGRHFAPDLEAWREAVASIEASSDEPPSLIALNAQHNPTALNWGAEVVRGVLRLAVSRHIPVLLDDAHFGVHDPACVPTSSLAILLEELGEAGGASESPLWLAVRSLGKQFRCNGWGLGAITSSPETLDELVNTYRVQHQYNYAGHLQYAMAKWLPRESCEAHLREQNDLIARNRRLVGGLLVSDLGYPPESFSPGECTSFTLFPVPPVYSERPEGTKCFLEETFFKTGVLLSDAWPRPRNSRQSFSLGYARIFIGGSPDDLATAFGRMAEAGIGFDMPSRLGP
jgi:aspartate/methionine/tyrosine aminotransferase